ncbi:oocyte zinc finger protein XlCOF28-like isoform X1 [Clytia hemisphaerica]|uniref:oocyte zinc finger protein XlCOF28-like isoform X1 n=2 Tax=Clytia hemisphaerica TaxID=252671 RepID=UPI0034D61397
MEPEIDVINTIEDEDCQEKPYGGRPLRFQCPDCDRKFHAPSHLKRHRLCHTSERPFQCHICKKGFLQAWHLGRHMTIHTGNKPFQCPECPKTFGSRFEMKTHCNYIHRGIKEHECTVCNKMFTLRSNLKVHMRKHTGEKPYQCEICLKKFGQRGHLQYHMRKHEESNLTMEKDETTSKKPTINDIEKPSNQSQDKELATSSEYGSDDSESSHGERSQSPTSPSLKTPLISTQSERRGPIKPIAISAVPVIDTYKYTTSSIPLSGRMFDHTNPTEIKPFVCVSCNCGFGEISSIRAHARHSHAKNGIVNELFSCAYCLQNFYSIDTLKFHFENCKKKLDYLMTGPTVVSRPVTYQPPILHQRNLKRSASEEYLVPKEKRMRPYAYPPASPSSLSTSSDTTADRRLPYYYKPPYYSECPPNCNCKALQPPTSIAYSPKSLAPPRQTEIESNLMQSRYLSYLKHCQEMLDAHVHWMEKLKNSRK